MTSGAWHADPTKRHELRYWNGAEWTDHVSDHGVTSVDRLAGPQLATTVRSADATQPARTSIWSSFRGLPSAIQVAAAAFGVVVALSVVGAASADREVTTRNVASETAAADEMTTTTEREVTTTSSAPTTTAAPTTTTAPPTTTTLPPTTLPKPTTTAAPPPTVAPRPVVAPTTVAPAPAAAPSGCHPSYQGTCIPAGVADADCAGGSGNGPYYVQESDIRVVGPDVFDLDGNDNDGLGCES